MVIPSNPLTLPCEIGLWLKVFCGTVQQSRRPDSSWGRCRERWYHTSLWGDVSCFCQEKGVLFQSYSKRRIEHPLIPCCRRRDWDWALHNELQRSWDGLKAHGQISFSRYVCWPALQGLKSSVWTCLCLFRKLNLGSVILNRCSQMNYFLQQ